MALSLVPPYHWIFGEPLFFTTYGDRQVTTFVRKGRSDLLSRFESPGSENYTPYTLSMLDSNNQWIEQEFATGGKFKLEADQILLINPR